MVEQKLVGVVQCCDAPAYTSAHLVRPLFGQDSPAPVLSTRAAYCRACGELTSLMPPWLDGLTDLVFPWTGYAAVHEDDCIDGFNLAFEQPR